MTEEEALVAGTGSEAVPLSLLHPDGEPAALVLLGHGLGVDRGDETVRLPARALCARHCTVLVPELPLHGVRAAPDAGAGEALVAAWQTYWAGGGWRALPEEWEALLGLARARFPDLPVAYFGLSLGTQIGITFLAGRADIAAAVLGLFGSEPPPRSQVMNACAPQVDCPVYFVQKRDDEIHPCATTDHLFGLLGSAEKVLDSTPGRHGEVSGASLSAACDFLCQRLRKESRSESRRES